MGQFDAFEETYDFEWDTGGHIPFYLGVAKETGGPVAEFACGTGRLLLPMARERIEVWGVEGPGQMAARFGRRLMDEPAEVRERVHLVEHDPVTADLGRTFKMAFIAFGGLQLFMDDAVVGGLLDTIAKHLEPGSVAAFDLVVATDGAREAPGALRHIWTRERLRFRETVSRFDAVSVDHDTRRLELTVFIDTVDETGQISRRVVRQDLRMIDAEGLEGLLAPRGLEVEGVYGSGQRAPVGPSDDRMFVIARKR